MQSKTNFRKIKIAIVKFGGLSAGGTEKFLQTVAANLNKDKFSVDYYYSDSAPYLGSTYKHADTDLNRKDYMEKNGINLIKFNLEAKDITKRTHDWVNTDFWDKFNEKNYDIIQTGRAGHPEYPFNKIKNTPIIDSLHLSAGVDNQYNISRVMHITKWSADKWIKMGGDKNRVVIVSHPLEITSEVNNLRTELKLEDKFTFGFHQRVDDNIFSPIPLEAYKQIENDKTSFIIMGGSQLYSKQAQELGIKNFKQIPHSAKPQAIYDFLQTLNVYAHGRKDGEVNSTAMAEAMFFGLPIISHISNINNGHIECIADAGVVVKDTEEYKEELKKIMVDTGYLKYRKEKSLLRFQEKYELKKQIENIEKIYEDVIKNPFPNKIIRFISSFRIRFLFKKLIKVIFIKF